MNDVSLENLKIELSKFGDIATIKADYVFTLLMFSKNKKIGKNAFKIMEIICKYTEDKYPIVEVIRQGNDYYLTVLKPKQ
jgi:hypothetical protein